MANVYPVKFPSVKSLPISNYVLLKETDKPISSGMERADILSHMASFYLSVLK